MPERHRTEVGISVAEQAGRLVHITEFAHLRDQPGRRPILECPACGDGVRPRVGPIRRGHFAHAARSDCWALTEEGRRHFEAKHHLARELRALERPGRAALGFPVRCGEDGSRLRASPDLFTCTEVGRHAFGEWSGVIVEKRVHLTTRRPDLRLEDEAGDTILAIEIVHSHAIDLRKAEELFAARIPWVEIDVSEGGFDTVMTWTHLDPDLPVSRASIDFAWRCTTHGVVEAPLHFRIVDNYYPYGPKQWEDTGNFRRDVYWVVRKWTQGNFSSDKLFRRKGNSQVEFLGESVAKGERIGALVGWTRARDEASEPVGTVYDPGTWQSLEHLPVADRLAWVDAVPGRFDLFPRRRSWDFTEKTFVWLPPPAAASPETTRTVAMALFYRLSGYESAWPERLRNPLDVPVVPERLRAAWMADGIWELLDAHMSGRDQIPGVPAFTKEWLMQRLRDPPAE